MPPLSPTTVTRLDPAVPPLWRDGDTLQFGLTGDIRITVDAPWMEALLARMTAGFRLQAFDVIAYGVGAPRREARQLLDRLRPLLVEDVEHATPAWVESLNLTDGRSEYRMREALGDEGVPVAQRDEPGSCGVVLVEGAAAALQFAGDLRDDRPHLPVAIESGRITVGPLVVPGATPCLSCRDAHERDRDPAWPRMHAQLIGRHPGPVSAARIASAATVAAALLRADSPAGAYAELSANGQHAWHSVTFHAECRCRDQSFRSLRGSATAPAPLAPPSATTTPRAYARPA
jgi:hypothetical protein